MLATSLSGIAEFERDFISERVKSGLAAAKAGSKTLGRQTGERPQVRSTRAEGQGPGC
ncbi:recombinase family protein [Ensifer psoraleae]|uniref:Recombinase family protein n=2 Tax=Sinorhizobium psoraleae TaxID=520838 RepID=A0ABT4KN38_9HYPH|nr:recombinase family protein [Sinorhizobium psoraleae]